MICMVGAFPAPVVCSFHSTQAPSLRLARLSVCLFPVSLLFFRFFISYLHAKGRVSTTLPAICENLTRVWSPTSCF